MDCMKHRYSFPHVVWVAALASALLAVTGVPSGASSPAPSNRFDVTRAGASFTLPAKWVHIPLDGNDISGILKVAGKNNPQLKRALTNEVTQAAKKGISFFAFGPITDNFAANLNIIETSAQGAPTGPSYYTYVESQLKTQLSAGGFRDLKVAVRQLPMGKEIEVNYNLSSGANSPPAQGLQLYVRRHDKVDILTFTSVSQKIDIAVARVVENSWKWN